MFLRRRDISPDVIDGMHLYDVLLEIMVAVDPAYSGEEQDSDNGRTVVTPKPGQTMKQARREAGLI